MANLTNFAFAISLLVGALAGLVKGVTGFAMPLIMISALSSFLTPDLALAGLILPTLVTNFAQAFRQGLWPALETARFFWRFFNGGACDDHDQRAVRPRHSARPFLSAVGPADFDLCAGAFAWKIIGPTAAPPRPRRMGFGGGCRFLWRIGRRLGPTFVGLFIFDQC